MSATDPSAAQGAELDAAVQAARAAIARITTSEHPRAFAELLALTQVLGEAVGQAARLQAERASWSAVADVAGTSRQAAWARWRG